MGCFGDNYGVNYDLCSAPVVVVPKPVSISHVTLDAGIDLRRKNTQRQKQILTLTVETPIQGTIKKSLDTKCDCVMFTKRLASTKLKLSLVKIQPVISIPISGSIIPKAMKQRSLFSVEGTKSYAKQTAKSLQTQAKLAKIDTLKQLLRDLDDDN